ncbi:MAG TPA: LLM class flavin-dependent oxidoreductase [Candidatus Limnocylindrales bacterium]|jgi:alkanesulfonate monooxygenase SsuD/methylene tetrahydromethanopterin reductase-like flavin-dependent oxidoreductase (luciferase family)|nr:LLM class flavin-dependent oxidoreductase [Candidatus Limnocylindrales bacterium]
MSLKLGAQVLTYGSSWPEALDTARLVDRLGYDYLWGHDHLYSTGGDPYQAFFEGWTTLAGWAQATSQVRLGLLVGANTFRNPGVVAKMAVTIDHISGGRSILGLGAGNVEFENRAHGIDPGKTLGQRLDWFEEAMAIVVDLLAGREVTHHSEKYQFDRVRHAPRPLQERVPVVIGAEGEKRGLRLAARHADIWQWFAGTDQVELFRHKDRVLREHCESEARDQSQIERMIGCKFIMRSDPAAAHQVAEELIAVHKWPAGIWDVVWAGTPQQVADWLTPFVEAGAGSFSPQIGWPYDHETIERLIGEVKPLVDARTG